MPRRQLAVALATALAILCPTLLPGQPATAIQPVAEWRDADNMHRLVNALDDWLDRHSDWPRRAAAPHIRLVSPWEAQARQGASGSLQRGRLRGLYDPDRAEILLVRPWNPRDSDDVSVLLHELVHHRQQPHHWYCPAAQELSAYRLQDAWLGTFGQRAAVNWVAVVLDAGCTPRDSHPD